MNCTTITREKGRTKDVEVSALETGTEQYGTAPHQSTMRRFYQVREEKQTSEYDLACNMKRYLLEQKKLAALVGASRLSQNSLEHLVRIFPDAGSFAILEQEHHDIKSAAGLVRKKYNRDHFMILEGTGEDIAIAEEFFINTGYSLIDAKTGTAQISISDFVGNFTFKHKEEENERMHRKIKRFVTPALIVLASCAFIFGGKSHSNSTSESTRQESREIAGATYAFSTKDERAQKAIAVQDNVTHYLKSKYPSVVFSICTPKYHDFNGEYATVEGVITGEPKEISEIRGFIEGGIGITIKKSHTSNVYKKSSLTTPTAEKQPSNQDQEATK